MKAKEGQRFFSSAGPFSLAELAGLIGADLTPASAGDIKIERPAALDDGGPSEISFIASGRYRPLLKHSGARACVMAKAHQEDAPEGMACLLVSNPASVWPELVQHFYPPERTRLADLLPEVLPDGAPIHPDAQMEEGVQVVAGAVIGAGARIGRGSYIGAGAVIGRGVHIGRDCHIAPHVSLICALLGDNVIIHAGARIGQDGFGYRPHKNGISKVPQVGRVIIQDDVEIGANTTIDRGGLGDSFIGEGTKIDNLVQIGHNCRIGRFCIIVSQVGLSGSVEVGDGVLIGGKAGIADHLTIGAGAQIAGKSGITRDIPAGSVYAGYPARPVREWRRQEAVLRNMVHKSKGSA